MTAPGSSEWPSETVLEPLRRHLRYPSSEFWIGPGWYQLALRCHEVLVAEFPDYVLFAVKQKWAALVVQADPRPSTPNGADWTKEEAGRLRAVTAEFDRLSRAVCESCGRPGTLRGTRHLRLTLCDDCETAVPPGGLWRAAP
ncbi:hypothetical protein [Embleya scabrispora]|uniref:hypothetical protein n=1 Tax=Embleya scabrispora TaxID=159449 RepID=UPI00037260B1|nr:hypothetical protein [Embleya scabrispora]MYS80243.1 hypothetical protein [Streptomyces sp. SID5474]